MIRLQFRTLYREFLWRLFDLELLAPDAFGDASRLLGRFAALMIILSLFLAMHALEFGGSRQPPEWKLATARALEHFLVSTTMVVVGVFAVLSWDSTFPDRRDVLVLGPLPAGAPVLFLAKAAAMASALGMAVLLLHAAAGLVWPLVLAEPGHPLRAFLAYWGTMFAAGAFVFCCLLGLQGLAAQLLPRRYFLRLSSFLQLAAFGSILGVYVCQPLLPKPAAFDAAGRGGVQGLWPAYWFVGLLQELNGSPPLATLARRAWMGLGVASITAVLAYALCYVRTIRQIVEQPDIVPRAGGAWLPRFGNGLQTALVRFSILTLLRSRLHRLVVVFYLGAGFAVLLFLLRQTRDWSAGVPIAGPSLILVVFALVGTRVIFAIPLDVRANWIFQVTGTRRIGECRSAARRSLLVIAVAPIWLASALLSCSFLPWREAAAQAVLLLAFALVVVELCLCRFDKIAFTCSYLPGRSQLHLIVLGVCFWLWIVRFHAGLERRLLQSPAFVSGALATMALVWLCLRLYNRATGGSAERPVKFEESDEPAVQGLGLARDGSWMGSPPVAS